MINHRRDCNDELFETAGDSRTPVGEKRGGRVVLLAAASCCSEEDEEERVDATSASFDCNAEEGGEKGTPGKIMLGLSVWCSVVAKGCVTCSWLASASTAGAVEGNI